MCGSMNYGRFYCLLNRLYCGCDKEAAKEALVLSFTDGRTVHLHEMTLAEYGELCRSLEERTGWREEVRKKRSLCLNLMQQCGVDTTDWSRVNDFCQNPRIAGKVFARLGVADLEALQVTLRAILRKGGLKSPLPTSPLRGGEGSAGLNGVHEEVLVIGLGNAGEA